MILSSSPTMDLNNTTRRTKASSWSTSRYNIVVNYNGTTIVPLHALHLVSSSSSASTARSYQSRATFSHPQVAFSVPIAPTQRPFAFHGSATFTHMLLN
jgi:hypothetical protein